MADIDIAAELARIDQLKAEAQAAQDAEDSAAQALRDRVNAAKAVCSATCGPVCEALAASTDPFQREKLIELEAKVHADHAAELEAAYRAISGQREGESNPAEPGTVQLAADIAALSDLPG